MPVEDDQSKREDVTAARELDNLAGKIRAGDRQWENGHEENNEAVRGSGVPRLGTVLL